MSGFVLRVESVHTVKGRGNIASCVIVAAPTPLPKPGERVAIVTPEGEAAEVRVNGVEMMGHRVGLVLHGDTLPLVGSAITPAGGHSKDCDGFRTAHWGTVTKVSSEGRGMWRAECFSEPGPVEGAPHWHGGLVGPGARDFAWKEANAHSEEVPCDGRCLTGG